MQHCPSWRFGNLVCKKTLPRSKFVAPPLAPFFFVRNRQPRESASARAPWPPVKPIRQTFYASRHRRPGRAAQRQKPKPELATGVGRSWLLPDAQGQGQSAAPSFLASLTAVIDKFGDFCARISSITNGSYLRDNVKFGQ